MNTFPVLLAALCVYAIGYRYYSAFIAAKALALDDRRETPAHTYEDGHNYVPSPKWVLFGHHFAAIAGAGPLVGPTLAAQFGFAPGFLWILIGAVLAGCVQDFIVLVASVRHKGRSLADVARTEVSEFTGLVAMFAVLLILLVTLAGLGVVVVNALSNSPWGVFTIGMTIPIAIFMGLYMFKSTPGQIKVGVPSTVGVVLLLASVWGGHWFAGTQWASSLTFTPHQITYLMAIYGFVASVLPVWLLLEPRDYLSTYVKLGTIALLVVGVFIVHPDIKFPALTQYVHGGGPIIKGTLFPFLFVTIACGAISGFHSLVSSGTTPKMLNKECDARFIGYGAMVAESLVAVLSLIAACSLFPGDYFGINVPAEAFAKLGLHTVNLDLFSSEVGEKLAGRTGGAVSLAVGMAQIFRGIPGMTRLMGYWYHYAIMFEALFILTTIDTGTRVARYVLQELLGKVHKPFANHAWQPGNMVTTFFVVLAWGYLIYTGNISTLWPLFGTGNQLLATIALAVGTAFLINMGKAKYAWITVAPMLFVGTTTLTAGVLSIKNIFWPLTKKPGFVFQGYLDSTLMAIFVTGVVLVLLNVARRCWQTLHGEPIPQEAFGPPAVGEGLPSSGCC
ncbi:MAG TPA: carbon starvation protein A [Candidatus Acidoferrales bacterium]|jgi:carbon starvation protein|nr:carbon starvation protein A [Candidatus Acidoferrales bacterium]